jgi:hypothetical protein
MKKIVFIIALASFTFKGYSQLKVLNDGKVGIGTLNPSERLELRGNLLIGGSYNFILKASGTDPGDVIFRGSDDVEYGRLYAFTNAVRFRANPNRMGDINIMNSNGYVSIGYFTPSYMLDVAGYIRGWNLTPSDIRFKSDIKPLNKSKDILRKMNGVSYLISRNYYKYNSADSTQTDNQIFDNKRHFGFIADSVQKILPELVHKDSSGYLSLDYISVIPLLVNAFNEQQSIIDAQSLKIKELDKRINELENKTDSKGNKLKSANTLDSEILSNDAVNAYLFQNIPNPFSSTTEINYFVPQEINSAILYVFDMKGAIIKTLPILSKGQGSVDIYGYELNPGMYIYSLLVDGKEVDTKRMILTE